MAPLLRSGRIADVLILILSLSYPYSAFALAPCYPSKVTCCFTVQDALQKVFIDDEDVTSLVSPQDGFINWMIPKTITFDEPLHDATLAVQGYQFRSRHSNIGNAGLQLSCVSTQADSPWNFASGAEGNWTSVDWLRWNRFPDNWFANDYSGPALQVVESTGGLNIEWNKCGAEISSTIGTGARAVTADTNRQMFTFKRDVQQTRDCPKPPPKPVPQSGFSADECVAGSVTCCITAYSIVSQVFVDGVEVTSALEPNGELLSDWTKVKVVTFPEPMRTTSAVLAIKVGDRSQLSVPSRTGVQVMCTSTRVDSPWNGLVSDAEESNWEAVVPLNSGLMPVADAVFPEDWYSNDFLGARRGVVTSTSKFYFREPKCGVIDRVRKIALNVSDTYQWFAVRKTVVQPKLCRIPSNTTTASPSPHSTTLSIKLIMDGQVSVEDVMSKPRSEGGFGVVSSPDNDLRQAMAKAVAFWQTIVTNSFPSTVCLPAMTSSLCGGGYQVNNLEGETCIDDIAVFVNVEESSSNDNTIASDTMAEAAVCAVDPTGRPRIARIHFNKQKLLQVALNPAELEVFSRHMLGHALGLGSLWEEWGFVSSEQATLTYSGEKALEKFHQLMSSSSPLLLDAAKTHWDESSVPGDLMSAGTVDVSRTVTAITLGAMVDLRYGVSEASMQQSRRRRRRLEQEPVGESLPSDVLILPLSTVTTVHVKPGREDEYDADLVAKRERDLKKQAIQQGTTNKESSPNTGLIIGIAIGAAVLFGVVGAVIYIVRRRRSTSRHQRRRSPSKKHASYLASPDRTTGPGWIERFDEETNQKFWLNRTTGEFSWNNPLSPVHSPSSSPSFTDVAIPSVMFESATPTKTNSASNNHAIVTVQPQEQSFFYHVDESSSSGISPTFIGSPTIARVSSSSIKKLKSPSSTRRTILSPPKTNDDSWTETYDAMTGTKYWLNRKTGEFSWSMPDMQNNPAGSS